MNQTAQATQLPMMRTSPATAPAECPPAAAAAAAAAAGADAGDVCSAKRQWIGDGQSLSTGPL